MMKFSSVALLLLPACSAGFFFNNNLIRPPQVAAPKPKVSSDEERAAAMSQYLAKAHEEKLRAVKAAEDKKQEEIRLLKEEIAALKAGMSPVVSAPSPGPIGELAKYQEFMKTYIVNAHKQKVDAIKAAEAALNKKWEEKLAQLGFGAPSPSVAPASEMLKPKVVDKLMAARNEGVKASASAGKSRWGESEVNKVKAGAEFGSFVKSEVPATLSAPPRGPVIAATPGAPITETPEIIAADHGLRADGGVGGPTLAERVTLGPNIGAKVVAGATSVVPKTHTNSLTLEERLAGGVNIGARILSKGSATAPVSVGSDDLSVFDKRNAKILHEAEVGKSRWGVQEIERVRSLPVAEASLVVPVPPEVAAADHGLRADGGVGGPTLAERIAFGANIGAKIVAQSRSATTPPSSSLYDKRNAQVAAAAAAGKSRWGSQEVAKLSGLGIESVEIVNSHEDIFSQRNNKVLAESAAGKSRWGKEEISRLQTHSASGPSNGFPARVNGSVVGA